MNPIIGKTIDDFRILKELGRGGMGVVYEAEQVSLGRKVALKILPASSSLSDTAVKRFFREAQAGGRQSHPGLVTVFAMGEQDGVHYIAQELVEGGRTLSQWLEGFRGKDGQHPGYFRECARLVSAVADALHHAHQSGVIHRDVKPSNILLTREDRPKVSDFGLAKMDGALSLSRSGEFTGTPIYMSPEQIETRIHPVDRRTDIYSLGVTLYEMLVLRPPFDGGTTHDVMKRILWADPQDPCKVNPRVPKDLSVICLKAMEKRPEKRYPTMTAFRDDLKRYLHGEVILAKPAGPGVRQLKRMKRHPVASAALGVAAATAAAFVFVVPWVVAQTEKRNARIFEEAKTRALAAEEDACEAQRNFAEQERIARARYEQIIQLADLQRVKNLEEEANRLWPAHPDRTQELASWIERADEVRARLDNHRAMLSAIREKGLSSEEEGGERTWTFGDVETQWQHDRLQELVTDLEAFVHEETGLLKNVQDRLAFASTVHQESITDHQAEWDATIASIADLKECPRYGELVIKEQLGLVPIGRDPDTGLFEFAHLQTGTIPVRDGDGRLVLTEETGLVFILIPGGAFEMGARWPSLIHPTGSPNVDPNRAMDEGFVRTVTLNAFFLSKYEMTQGQWKRFTGKNPSTLKVGGESGKNRINPLHPVWHVSWDDCVSTLSRLHLRLPSEAEWEYAARAGTTTIFWTGNDPQSLIGAANICDVYAKNNSKASVSRFEDWLNDGYFTHAPVGRFRPNAFGLHDITGNVSEWCQDAYGPYASAPRDGSAHEDEHMVDRIFRGADYYDTVLRCRMSYRSSTSRFFVSGRLGLRPALDLRQ